MRKEASIGIDLGGTAIKSGLVTPTGRVVLELVRKAEVPKGRAHLLGRLRQTITDLLVIAREKKIKVTGIGLGSPGTVNVKTGVVVGNCPNIPHWVGVNLVREIGRKFRYPFACDNDANLMALAELRLGAARGVKTAICLTLGTGVGGGIVINGEVYRGAWYAGAELGHTTIAFDGPRCKCGNYGCLEVFVSAPALVRRFQQSARGRATFGRITPEKIFALARGGNREARVAVAETGRMLGVGLASFVNAFNPEVIVIGGGVAEGGPLLLQAAKRELRRRAFVSATRGLQVKRAQLGNRAGFIGAALYVGEAQNR